MMQEKWQPLTTRLNGGHSSDDTLHEGVPPHLEPAIRDWLWESSDKELLARMVSALRVQVSHVAFAHKYIDNGKLLDAVDFVLHAGIRPRMQLMNSSTALRYQLQWLLDDGGSAYRVNDGGTGLERRVEPTSSESAREVMRSATGSSAAEHLKSAWQAVYGLRPDPPKAYSEAIKAVEAAAQPVIEPNNHGATLGSMLGALRGEHNVGRWEVTLAGPGGGTDLSVVMAMCRTLWTGQSSRHGSGRPTRYETQDEAEAALHLAVALVSWFTTGKIRSTRR